MAAFTGLAVAGLAAAGAGAAGSFIGGKKKAKAAARKAAAIQAATGEGLNDYRAARDYTTNAFSPLETNFAGDYADFRGDILGGEFDPRNYNFEADPGYQWRMDEGQRALERTAAARGNLLSGSQLKAATRYGQDYASNEYDRAYNRNANSLAAVLGQRQGLVNYGMQGAQMNAGAWNNYASQAAPFRMQGVLGQQSALAEKANAKADMWGGITNSIGQGIGSLTGGFGGFGGGGGGMGGMLGNVFGSTGTGGLY